MSDEMFTVQLSTHSDVEEFNAQQHSTVTWMQQLPNTLSALEAFEEGLCRL